jgi:hypothetical protein
VVSVLGFRVTRVRSQHESRHMEPLAMGSGLSRTVNVVGMGDKSLTGSETHRCHSRLGCAFRMRISDAFRIVDCGLWIGFVAGPRLLLVAS